VDCRTEKEKEEGRGLNSKGIDKHRRVRGPPIPSARLKNVRSLSTCLNKMRVAWGIGEDTPRPNTSSIRRVKHITRGRPITLLTPVRSTPKKKPAKKGREQKVFAANRQTANCASKKGGSNAAAGRIRTGKQTYYTMGKRVKDRQPSQGLFFRIVTKSTEEKGGTFAYRWDVLSKSKKKKIK